MYFYEKMVYCIKYQTWKKASSPPGAVNVASYKELLNQYDCWKHFYQL